MKIITICGSLKFQNEMMLVVEKLSLEGYCVFTPVYQTSESRERTGKQIEKLRKSHFKKIELSDAIFVVNVNNYIGSGTKQEIEYAQKLGKEIMYYSELIQEK